MGNIDKYPEKIIELIISYGPKLIYALITLIIGLWLIKIFIKIFDKAMDKGNVDITLQKFLLNLSNVFMKVILVIIVASMVGVETTSLIALLGAAGLAVGLALQGSLANFAGGVLILLFKPYKVGDLIEAQGYTAIVAEIQIFNTILKTLDNQRVIIPNSLLTNGCLKNVSAEKTRRVDMTFGIGYNDDILKTKDIIRNLIKSDNRILETPESEIYVSEHANSSINLLVRVWVNSENYWPVHFNMLEQVKLAFDREGITIPYPQRDIHMYREQIQN